MSRVFFILVFSIAVISGFGQAGQVAGKVLDAETQEPLPFAHVFVNNTTVVTTTDADGNFLLGNIAPGQTEVVSTFVGYESAQAKIYVKAGVQITITLQLKPLLQDLQGVEVKGTRDKVWEKQLHRFEKIFFGSRMSSSCTINNPWVIDFSTQEESQLFIAKATGPIEISNHALGYTLFFYLKNFQSDGNSYIINGSAYFKEMIDSSKTEYWKKNRVASYLGSERHLFKSILDQSTNQEDFRLYIDKPGARDINSRSDIFYSDAGVKVIEYNPDRNTIRPTGFPNEYTITLSGRTEVHYLKKNGTPRLYRDMPGQVTWIEVKGNTVRVNGDGIVLNPGDMVLSGEMSALRIGSLLPLDYQPPKTTFTTTNPSKSLLPIEKAYLNTDKPYYYPGETIWMKVRLNYQHTSRPDTMSNVLYAELINDARKIVQAKILRIDSGWTFGEFDLSKSLPSGSYMIRVFSNWMRNFGDALFYSKPFPVLQLNEKIETSSSESKENTDNVFILPEKEIYRVRDKITVDFVVKNSEGDTVQANLSVSVTDVKQVAGLRESENILTGFTIPDVPNPAEIFFDLESGITIKGLFKNKKQKPEQATLTGIVGDFEQIFSFMSHENGRFELKGLDFYDSASFGFQAKDKKGVPYGFVEMHQREVPSITAWKSYRRLPIIDAGSVQRILSDYEVDKNSTTLEEITVSGKRMEVEPEEMQHKIFGKPEHLISSDDLLKSGATNLAVALQGKVPGLTVTTFTDSHGTHYVVRLRAASSFSLGNDPLVLVDGVPVGGSGGGDTAGDRLRTLDISIVDRVEISSRTNSMYGDAGRNGVISVFTKTGVDKRFSRPDQKAMDFFSIKGFSRPKTFRSPVYENRKNENSQVDYRSTIYWAPMVPFDYLTKRGTITFYAAELPTLYRIVVEGITETGEPVYAETTIVISSD